MCIVPCLGKESKIPHTAGFLVVAGGSESFTLRTFVTQGGEHQRTVPVTIVSLLCRRGFVNWLGVWLGGAGLTFLAVFELTTEAIEVDNPVVRGGLKKG